MVLGHVKAGVTPAQAIADLNSVGSYLEKDLPQRRCQYDLFAGASKSCRRHARARGEGIHDGHDAAVGLILLAACANLGSLFAARAADRSREVALAARAWIEPQTHSARSIYRSCVDFTCRRRRWDWLGSVALLRELSTGSRLPEYPIVCAGEPGRNVYLVALLLALASGFLFGAVPVRQILRTNPYESSRRDQPASLPAIPAGALRSATVAGGANCHLRRAGDFFAGCRARAGALHAQQLRI
jgi:hypothetical protein